MNLQRKIDKTMERVFKRVPSLPKNVRKLIAENLWWISLISSIILAIFTFVAITDILTPVPYSRTVIYYAKSIISLIFMLSLTVLLSVASKPLEEFRKRGWQLLLAIVLVGTTMALVNIILNFSLPESIMNLAKTLLTFLISAYLLRQVRGVF